MFRYIAIAWSTTDLHQQAWVREAAQGLLSRGWQSALHRPGLCVLVTGARRDIDPIRVLAGGRGIVLGPLFRRAATAETQDGPDGPAEPAALSDRDAFAILGSGGAALTREYWGRYVAFLGTDPHTTTVVRDPTGGLPCYLVRHAGVWIACNWFEDLLAHLQGFACPSIHWEGVAGHLVWGALGGRETALEDVLQVTPGEALDLSSGPCSARLLWNAIEFARASQDAPVQDALVEMRRTVRHCSQTWTAVYGQVLLRLSGGVDSSILAATLARDRSPAEVVCLNYHSPGSDSDERRYARLAAARAGRLLVERERDADFPLERVLSMARTATPESHLGRMNARTDAAEAAAHGARALFTGAGGDPLFFEFARWWPAADYLFFQGLDARWPGIALAAARLGEVSLWTAMAQALAQRMRPTPPWREGLKHLPLIGEAAWAVAGQRARFAHPASQDLHRLPIGKATQVMALLHPAAGPDPIEVERAVETVHPLLSQPLIELCLQQPTWLLTTGGQGRGLVRRAFAAELPAEVAGRRTKGGMEEHIREVLRRNLPLARELLLDGELARRGLLDRQRLEAALADRPTTLPAHTGRLHVYIGLEAWIRRWRSAPTRPTA